jgi:hypothetical protein
MSRPGDAASQERDPEKWEPVFGITLKQKRSGESDSTQLKQTLAADEDTYGSD